MISLRYGFTNAANLFTLLLAITLILTINDRVLIFRVLVWILTGIGASLSIFFIVNLPEKKLSDVAEKYDTIYREQNTVGVTAVPQTRKTMSDEVVTWKNWLTNGAFYIHLIVYTFARMAVNVTMTLTPFYLIHVLEFEEDPGKPPPAEIAAVPLASFVTSMIFPIFIYNRLLKRFGNRMYPLAMGT